VAKSGPVLVAEIGPFYVAKGGPFLVAKIGILYLTIYNHSDHLAQQTALKTDHLAKWTNDPHCGAL